MKMKRLHTLFFGAALIAVICGASLAGCGEHQHKFGSWIDSTPATCTEAGVVAHKDCKGCGKHFNAEGEEISIEIPPLGHDLDAGVLSTPPTCTTPGVRTRTCRRCSKPVNEPVSPYNHDWDDGEVIEPASCSKQGLSKFTCLRCQTSENRRTDKLPHTWDVSLTVRTEPECEKNGSEKKTCKICNETVTEILPKLGHELGSVIALEPATCEKEGSRTKQCTRCKKTVTEKIDALGHNWQGDYTIDVKPDFGKPGSKSYHCSRCDQRRGEVTIPALSHGTKIEYEFITLRNTGERIDASGAVITVYNAAGDPVATSTRSTLVNGSFKTMLEPETYTVKVAGLPAGYSAETSYTVIPQEPICRLWLTASPIASPASSSLRYSVGDVMHDFTYKTVYGENISLSALLKKKRLVLLNFFYVNCQWCNAEFPGLVEVYKRYRDDVAVIAIDPYLAHHDSEDAVRKYAENYSMAFDGIVWDANLELNVNFGVTSYPANIVIDKEGVITMLHHNSLVESDGNGGYDSSRLYANLFDRYLADSYWQNRPGAAVSLQQRCEVALPAKRESD